MQEANKMSHNVGNTDRIVRLLIGLAIVAAGLYFQSWLILVAIIPFATALIGWCPLYSLFGLSTCPVKSRA
jgi:hypothetical protein